MQKNPENTRNPDFLYPVFGLKIRFYRIFLTETPTKYVTVNWRQKNWGVIGQKILFPVTPGLDFRTGLEAFPVRIPV